MNSSLDDKEIVFHHKMPAQIRFSDVDQFGHVNNAVYFELYDMGKTQYFYDVVGPDALDKIAIVVVKIEASFLAPIFYPDNIVIQTALIHLGNKSFVLRQQAINPKTGEVKCESRTTMVVYDKVNKQSIPMPEDYRQKIIAFEGIKVIGY